LLLLLQDRPAPVQKFAAFAPPRQQSWPAAPHGLAPPPPPPPPVVQLPFEQLPSVPPHVVPVPTHLPATQHDEASEQAPLPQHG
jgi:hypothetical protein